MSSASPRVSVIVPSWTGEVDRLVASLREQTFSDFEIKIVRGVSPAARARNLGAQNTTGDILLFVDDDAYLGDEHVMQRLVDVLDGDLSIAVTGTSKLAPPDASRFQRAVVDQVPRMSYPVEDEDTESNPPLGEYGFTAITTTCAAVRRSVFDEIGGFDESMGTGGEDTKFFARVRADGHRIVLAGRTWVYHDPPPSLKFLLRKSFFYGVGHAHEARRDPSRGMDLLHLGDWRGRVLVPLAVLAFPVALFVHVYFDPDRRFEMGFRPLKTLSTYAVLAGYVYGWTHQPATTAARTYQGRLPAAMSVDNADVN
ncbi:MAG: glycosyltransferase family 2 protein [Jatrophihabitans sp.]|uniref:glycosyltransferase family 2 protein n=1 Tax=Jatrophihabitans sp. TaxID=1932789 RepID=UPI003F7E8749